MSLYSFFIILSEIAFYLVCFICRAWTNLSQILPSEYFTFIFDTFFLPFSLSIDRKVTIAPISHEHKSEIKTLSCLPLGNSEVL